MENLVHYNVIAKIYGLLDIIYFRNNNRNPRRALASCIEQTDARILDVCTGTAANAIEIAKRNQSSEITGIDISKEMLNIAENKVKMLGLKNVHLYERNAFDTGYKDNTFDVIVIALVLHEVSQEACRKIILEAKRILKPDGKLLVLEWEKPKSTLRKLIFYPIRKMEPKGFDEFLKLDMKSYFQQFGLMVTDIKHCDYSKVLCIKPIK